MVATPIKLRPASPFTRLAETYETIFPAMRLYAADAVSLVPPITASSVVHDNGCGPGIVAAEILSRQNQLQLQQEQRRTRSRSSQQQQLHAQQLRHPPDLPRIEATDISPAMASAAARRGPAVHAQVMDSRQLSGFDDGVFTHSFSNFVVLGMSDADAARVVSEMRRTLRPGGVAVLTAWRALGYVELFEQVAWQVAAAAPGHKNNSSSNNSSSSSSSSSSTTHARAPWPQHHNHQGIVDTREAVLSEEQLRLALERGGFHDRDVELRSVTRALPWALWTHEAYAPIRRSMCDNFTRGWPRDDIAQLDATFAERIARLAEEGASYRIIAWVAVMVKS